MEIKRFAQGGRGACMEAYHRTKVRARTVVINMNAEGIYLETVIG